MAKKPAKTSRDFIDLTMPEENVISTRLPQEEASKIQIEYQNKIKEMETTFEIEKELMELEYKKRKSKLLEKQKAALKENERQRLMKENELNDEFDDLEEKKEEEEKKN